MFLFIIIYIYIYISFLGSMDGEFTYIWSMVDLCNFHVGRWKRWKPCHAMDIHGSYDFVYKYPAVQAGWWFQPI